MPECCRRYGIPTTFFAELDEICREVHQATFPAAVCLGRTEHGYPSGDVLQGDPCRDDLSATANKFVFVSCGFPCPDFSRAGKGEGIQNKVRGQVVFHVIRLAAHFKWPLLLLENVEGLFDKGYHEKVNDGKVLAKIVKRLTESGYSVRVLLLDSEWIGIPHHRPRVFLACFLNPDWSHMFERQLDPTGVVGRWMRAPKGSTPVSSILQRNVARSHYLKQAVVSGWRSEERATSKRRKHEDRRVVVGETSTRSAPCLCAGYGGRGAQGLYVTVDPKLSSARHSEKIAYREYSQHRHPQDPEFSGVRTLTITECYRLQDFRVHERFNCQEINVPKHFAYTALGNAVTVGVAEVVIGGMLTAVGIPYSENPETAERRKLLEQKFERPLCKENKTTVGGVEYWTYDAKSGSRCMGRNLEKYFKKQKMML
eukprot:TRINITY_DN23331_c0_g1_i1.p1 TRINITY_DN23331_c0_g1~~TRINITY_DN23331_c0_g1_i1.p1  ORF type:complete len:426 (-),score=61.80 TRINITY_DN23331_c0_g1_i1:1-1278(-)